MGRDMVAKKPAPAPRKAAPRKGVRKRPTPLQQAPPPLTDRQRIEVLEAQVKELRMTLTQMMLQNPQVQKALAQRIVESGVSL